MRNQQTRVLFTFFVSLFLFYVDRFFVWLFVSLYWLIVSLFAKLTIFFYCEQDLEHKAKRIVTDSWQMRSPPAVSCALGIIESQSQKLLYKGTP